MTSLESQQPEPANAGTTVVVTEEKGEHKMTLKADLQLTKEIKFLPVQHQDWTHLTKVLTNIKDEFPIFESLGSLAVGAAISILLQICNATTTDTRWMVACAISFVVGCSMYAIALYFRGKRSSMALSAKEVVKLIESKFPQPDPNNKTQ